MASELIAALKRLQTAVDNLPGRIFYVINENKTSTEGEETANISGRREKAIRNLKTVGLFTLFICWIIEHQVIFSNDEHRAAISNKSATLDNINIQVSTTGEFADLAKLAYHAKPDTETLLQYLNGYRNYISMGSFFLYKNHDFSYSFGDYPMEDLVKDSITYESNRVNALRYFNALQIDSLEILYKAISKNLFEPTLKTNTYNKYISGRFDDTHVNLHWIFLCIYIFGSICLGRSYLLEGHSHKLITYKRFSF